MSRQIIIVDPLFSRRLRELRQERRMSLRSLATVAHYSHGYLWELEKGTKLPSAEIAWRLDEALESQGALAHLVSVTPASTAVDPDDIERMRAVAVRPRSVDPTVIDSLSLILAQQRRMEDAVGSRSMLPPVIAHLGFVQSLVRDAHGALRESVLRVSSQWAQFAGWLNENTHNPDAAGRCYGTALEWATEINDPDMIATALNMRGHIAWMAGEVGPVIGLSRAAGALPASAGVRALAAQQEARGHAIVGEADDTDRLLDRAWELAATAAEHPESEPPWIYFHDPDYLRLQRGLAYRYLGRLDLAEDWLSAGLSAMRPEMRRAEWVGTYVYQLGLTRLAGGELDGVQAAIDEIDQLAGETASARLARLADGLRGRVSAAVG